PSSDETYMREVRDTIYGIHIQYPKATIWTSGDFNLPDIDWEYNTITSYNYNRSINQHLLDLLYDTGSEQMIKFPTRGNNTLDLFITNRPSLIVKTKPAPGLSDHDIVFVEAGTQAARKKLPKRKIFLWKNVNTEAMGTEIDKFTSDFTQKYTTSTDINVLWSTFKTTCISIMDEQVPTKQTSSRFNQPWINRKLKRLTRRKKRAYMRSKKSGTQEHQDAYKQLQKDTQRECKKAYNTYVEDLVSTDRNPKKLYTFINGKRCESSGVPLLKKDGLGYSDPKSKARILNEQFSSVFTQEDTSRTPSMDTDPYPTMGSFNVEPQGVKKLLLNLDPHKAQGPDNIPTRLLKDFATEITPALTLIFQASIEEGKVPDDWKTALVTPVFKKGDRTAPANYRPISLTSVCCKLLEHIIHSQVMHHLDLHSILTDQQHGFRKKRSCESQLVITIQDLASAIEEGEQIDAILLDFSKAFDKVPHGRLAQKLHHYGIRGELLHWIESFLSGRHQQVLVEGQESPSAPVTSGVPQGSVLGPLLFLLYINDMPGKVASTSRLFADDSLLYRRIRTQQDASILQEDLRKLEKWETDWQMQFNPTKCETIRITRKRNPIKTTYNIHGHDLATVTSGKYLGTTIHEKLLWNDHVDAVTKKANNSLAFLRRNITSCPADIKAQCYKTLVRPIMEYAAPAWDPHTTTNINQLEAVQRRAARFVTGDYRRTSSTSQMLATLGWPTLQQRRSYAKLVLVYRITHALIDIPAAEYLHPIGLSTRGHSLRYLVPFSRTDAHRHSFFPSGIRLWNQLPEHIANSQTLDSFKAGLGSQH
ncbi:MAG: hypothetical protein JAZ03_21935, partial [Candidatus Thiodiazotropha taylori]|nr:hypothetical protein [Candidatus Thiodiazotropha taylori]MCW4336589.1 reverse transcriptase domain-containing protein [Candidatus Thiodiazotropha endolucinida]